MFILLDFGVEHLAEVAKEMKFPWLMSNARLHTTGQRLADGHEKLILNWRGRKVSFPSIFLKMHFMDLRIPFNYNQLSSSVL